MLVTWWMPARLAGSLIVSFKPMNGAGIYVSPEPSKTVPPALPGRRLLIGPTPDLSRQGFFELLLDVADKPDRPRHHGQPAAYPPRDGELARDGADGSGSVDRQVACRAATRLCRYRLHELNVPAGKAVFGRQREEPRCSRIDGLVDWVSQACDRPLPFLLCGDDMSCQLVQLCLRTRSFECFLQGACGLFDRASKTVADAQQSRCHGALQRLGGAVVGEAGGDRARRHPVLNQRHGQGVEHC